MDWRDDYKRKLVSKEEMAKRIQSNDLIMTGLGLGNCSPGIYHAILDRWEELRNVRIMDAVPVYPNKTLDPNFMKTIDGHINHMSGFFSPGGRAQGASGISDFLPCMTSDAAEKFALLADAATLRIEPPANGLDVCQLLGAQTGLLLHRCHVRFEFGESGGARHGGGDGLGCQPT